MPLNKNRISNELLVLRCRRGDQKALQELIDTWEMRLFYYIRRLVDKEEDAWDTLQQTWVKALRGIGTLKDPASLPAWLYTIARNTTMSHLRGVYTERALVQEAIDHFEEEPDNEAQFDNAELVHAALAKLSFGHREALTLFFLDDLSIAEIAQVLDLSAGTVKSRLFHARHALRREIEKEATV